jgi:hypothetical protein
MQSNSKLVSYGRPEQSTRRDYLFRVLKAGAGLGLFATNIGKAYGQAALDRFGIQMLYPTPPGGRVWSSTWDNGHSRSLNSGQRDPYDSQFVVRGDVDPTRLIRIDGQGTATLAGAYPRLYVYDLQQAQKWRNVEVTFYAQRVSETGVTSSQGFVARVRSEHQNTDITPCAGQAYYGRMLYDGRINFQKEVAYEKYFSTNQPSESSMAGWPGGTQLTPNLWVGYKLVAMNVQWSVHAQVAGLRFGPADRRRDTDQLLSLDSSSNGPDSDRAVCGGR